MFSLVSYSNYPSVDICRMTINGCLFSRVVDVYIRYIKGLGVDLFARGPQIVLNKLDDQCKPSVQQIFEKQINKILNILQ